MNAVINRWKVVLQTPTVSALSELEAIDNLRTALYAGTRQTSPVTAK